MRGEFRCCATARRAIEAYLLGTPIYPQLVARGGPAVEQVLTRAERAVRDRHGPTPIAAKMQAIVYKATLVR